MRQSQGKGTSDSICCGSSNLLMSIQLFQSSFITLLLKVFWLFPSFAGFIILMLSRHSLQRIAHFNSKIICDKVSSLSLWSTNAAQSTRCYEGPWPCPVWGVRTLAPWTSFPLSGRQNQQGRELVCPHSSSTPEQGVISPLCQLN